MFPPVSSPYARAAAERLATPVELRAGFQEFTLSAAALTTRLRSGPVPGLAHALATIEYQAAVLELATAAVRDARGADATDATDAGQDPESPVLSDPCARGLAELAERARVLPGMARLRGRFLSLAQGCERVSRAIDAA